MESEVARRHDFWLFDQNFSHIRETRNFSTSLGVNLEKTVLFFVLCKAQDGESCQKT